MRHNSKLTTQNSQLFLSLLWPFLLYTGLTLLLTYPVITSMGAAAAGFAGRDSFQHVWYQWWLKETLLELRAWPDRVSSIYYPLGASHPVLALHPFVPLASLPVTLLLGPLVSYNLAFILSFCLAGLAGYLLGYYLTRQTGAAWLGGLIFAFYPNRWGHAAAGHLLLITNYMLPLYGLSLLLLLRRPSTRRAIWHGLVTAGLLLAQPTHIGYGLIPLLVVLAGWQAWQDRPGSSRIFPVNLKDYLARRLAALAVAYLAAGVIFLPFAWPTLVPSGQGNLAYLQPPDLTEHATNLLAFILPSPYNPLLAGLDLVPAFSQAIIDSFRDLEEQLAYPGLVAVSLAGLALWRKRVAAWPWLILAGLCAVLSLGPLLKIGGQVYPVSLPYHWLAQLPFFAWSRAPGRLNETVMLAVAALAALGVASRQAGGRPPAAETGPACKLPGGRALGLVGLSGLILLEYTLVWPFPVDYRPVPGYYAASLAAEPPAGGVLELPVTGSRRASNYAMYYQTVHQQPLAGGYIERDPPGTVELKEFLNALVSPLPVQTVLAVPGPAERRAILADMGIRRVIAHPDLMTDQAARATVAYLPELLGSPLVAVEDLLVYPVPLKPVTGLPVHHLLPDLENWEVIGEGGALRLKGQGYLFVYSPGAGQADLRLYPAAPPAPVQLSAGLNDGPAATTPPRRGGRGRYTVEPATTGLALPLSLRPGLNYIRLTTEPAQELDFLKIELAPAPALEKSK